MLNRGASFSPSSVPISHDADLKVLHPIMKAYLFPGQGSQFTGMGKDHYESSPEARALYESANDTLGYILSEVMFSGTEEDLRQTRITQPAIYVHSYVRAQMLGDAFQPDAVAGHSLGEFTALAAAGAFTFEEGLLLVRERAEAMQSAGEQSEGTMAAVIGLEDEKVEDICRTIGTDVVPANYNSPGQLVISGSMAGIAAASEQLLASGASKVIPLVVGGAFHSPLMQPARDRLERAINQCTMRKPRFPVYQNVTARPETDPEIIRKNLVEQLTAPVLWTQTMLQMIADGLTHAVEVGGKGRILCALLRRINRNISTDSI